MAKRMESRPKKRLGVSAFLPTTSLKGTANPVVTCAVKFAPKRSKPDNRIYGEANFKFKSINNKN
jgi:hypothetical protein